MLVRLSRIKARSYEIEVYQASGNMRGRRGAPVSGICISLLLSLRRSEKGDPRKEPEGGRDQGGRGYMEAKRGTRSGTEGWKFFKKHLASKDNVNKSYRKITAERR